MGMAAWRSMNIDSEFCEPRALLDRTEQALDRVPNADLFNNPKYQKLREAWCAAMFGLGYSKYVAPCKVAVNDGPTRQDVDFYLSTDSDLWEFQLAETQKPGRRRGDEYKRGDVKLYRVPFPSDAEPNKDAPSWLAAAADKKKAKRYAGSDSLHLLIYLNFDGPGLEYKDVAAELRKFSGDFASLWIVSSLHICSIFTSAGIGAVPGWGDVRDPSEYYP
jgi:hypothetical protein